MEYFTEQASTYMEAMNSVRLKYGERAKVMTHRSVRIGGFLGLFSREGVEVSGYLSADGTVKKGTSFATEKKKILENVRQENQKKEDTLLQVLQRVQSIEQKIGDKGDAGEEFPALAEIEKLLIRNDFSYDFIKKCLRRLRKELPLEQLDSFEAVQERVLSWIAGSLPMVPSGGDEKKHIILVGPTGVGKTTTIAKLGAMHSLGLKGEKKKDVRMITIDSYRIGAKGQIQTYGELMDIPVACVESAEELKKQLVLFSEAELILIDTMGRSPKDYHNLASMREFLDVCGGNSSIYLTVSATTKAGDLKEILQEFSPFRYERIILTKLDETMKIGNIVSTLSESSEPLAYFTDGQGVPQDIQRARVLDVLKRLDGFKIRSSDWEEGSGVTGKDGLPNGDERKNREIEVQ